jgi:hypothetical protein
VADVLFRAPLNRMPGGDPRPAFAAPPPPATVTKRGVDRLADSLYERLQAIDRPKGKGTSISQIPAGRFAAAVIELATAENTKIDVDGMLNELQTAESPLYHPLNSLWLAAKKDVDRFRTGVEDWFDGEMQRLSRFYRRNVRWVIAVLSALIALFIGLDTLEYGRALISDQAFRTQVVAVASGNPDKLSNLQATCGTLENQKGDQQPQPDAYRCISEVLADPAFAQLLGDSLVRVDLSVQGSPRFRWNGRDWFERTRSPGHWLGLLLTVVAMLFGAPFWWDILRRLTGVRSSASIASTRSG